MGAGYFFLIVIEFFVLIANLIISSFKINKLMDDSINMNHLNTLHCLVPKWMIQKQRCKDKRRDQEKRQSLNGVLND